ncbi:RHS repeat-associated core domain-containing protein [Mucilaginibacter auburnensis]|uniref:RHS repeat-associated protein n=1 Tax=Mucilaginibacter auburnensis TaxID=1457233 RepID=A0A2H9VPM4_9SPHI|nr:RHS repeat-associated core domain-containing protein [Mucilaginibacter auburnensis]PJJ80285.1 RHS repeat-associated protein [Mucilaginibacter auburnensis]
MNLKKLITTIFFSILCLTSVAYSQVIPDSLKKDTTKTVNFADTIKYIKPDPNNRKKPIVTVTSGKSTASSIKGAASSDISDLPLSNTSSLSSATIDPGRTVTAIDVSSSGASTYTVPIAVPPGISGVVPKIALVYNSQGGDGLAGYGWNISGLSTITRIPATRFHDDRIGVVKGDMDDRFALDGQRLLLKSGTYGADGAEYQTENYSNTKIVSHGSLGTGLGPQYFDVYYADGSHAVYGQNADSRTKNTYSINYMDNPQNVRISYTYTKSNEVSVIDQIAYGALNSGTAINQINFTYDVRQRTGQLYIGGTEIRLTKILKQIDVVGNGVGYRTYALTHNTIIGFNYEQIATIQEISGDGTKSFEPIYFYYGDNHPYFNVTTSTDPYLSGISGLKSNVLTGDFNGNGKMDIVVYPTGKNKFWIKWDPGKITSDAFTDAVDTSFFFAFASTYLKADNKVAIGQGLLLVQEPSDGVIVFKTYSEGAYSVVQKEYQRIWNAPVKACAPGTNPSLQIPRRYCSGDFNGDGLTDVIAFSLPYSNNGCTSDTTARIHFINLDRRLSSNFVTASGSLIRTIGSNDKIYTGDFNGDDKTDLLHITPERMYVYNLNEANELVLLWAFTSPTTPTAFPPLFGDFNGDGKTDIMFPTANNNIFTLFISTGKGFIKQDKTYPFSSANALIPNDANNDGKTDIISYTTTTNNAHWGNANVKVYNNIGPGEFGLGSEVSMNTHLDNFPIPLFLNNEQPNYELEFGLLSDNTITQFSNLQDMKSIRGLKTVAQAGVIHRLEYKAAVPDDGYPVPIYIGDEKHVYPYVNMKYAPGIKVVSKLRRIFTGTAPSDVMQIFNYKSAVRNMAGLGYLGFTETVRSNWIKNDDSNDQRKIFTTNVTDPLLRGAIVRSFTSKSPFISDNIKNAQGTTPDIVLATAVNTTQTVVAAQSITMQPGFSVDAANGIFIAQLDDPANGMNDGAAIYDYITRTDYTYNTQLLSSKVFINKPTAVIVKDLLNKTNTLTSYGYDSYYNVNHYTSNFSGHGTKTVDYVFNNNPTSWYFGRVNNKKETSTIGGDSFSTEEQYSYTGAFVTQIKRKGNGTNFITEDYEPDAFGNVKKKTVTTSDGSRVIKTDYDASGRFVVKLTGVDGLETNMTYNSSNGTMSSLTNSYGQTTNYDYDVWGRVTETRDYLNNKTNIGYGGVNTGSISVFKTNDEGQSNTTVINALGQTTSIANADVLGQYVSMAYGYDIYGGQISRSEPGIGSYGQVNTTEYDNYGRVISMSSFTGKTTSISYNGLQTTVNDGTKTVVTTRDAMGNIKSVQDPGGTINYAYFGNGGLKSTDYGGSAQAIEQDGWGRKTKLTDPSAGVYTYTYNEFGEPLSQTTPKGVTNYTYLPDGRLNTRDIVSDNTNMHYVYGYNSATKLLETINLDDNIYHNDIDYTYGYDVNKRLISVVEENPQARFAKTLTYNSLDQVANETNEAKNKANNITVSKTLTYIYSHGEVKEITNAGNSIWKVTAQDARGHVTTALLGTALKQTNTYDSFGSPTEFRTDNVTGIPVELMKLGFSFDAVTANLTSRTNSAFNPTPGNPWTESFTYDNQDRLTGFNENSATVSNTQSYDARGRITINSQLGNYTYTGNSYQQAGLTNLSNFAINNYQNRQLQQVTYNAFKAPVTINEDGKERIDFEYNGAGQRSHMYYGSTNTTKTARPFVRHYSEDGSMEITEDKVTGKTGFVFYLGGDAYTAPAIWKYEQTGGTVNTNGLYYLLRDYLGSIIMITDANGAVQEKRHFDAWGNIVKMENGAGVPLNALQITDRGYTGHEHLQGVGLINMNARLYDPLLHRFLAPDDVMQDPFNTQNYNRYAYVLNNPLKYTDPTGNYKEETEAERKAREQREKEDAELLDQLRREGQAILDQVNIFSEPSNDWGGGGGGGSSWDFGGADNNSSANAISDQGGNQIGSCCNTALAGVVIPLGGVGTGTGIGTGLAELVPPVALAIATAVAIDLAETAATDRKFITYIKRGPNGKVYVGRTSGTGRVEDILRRRDATHHMKGYGPAVEDRVSAGVKISAIPGFGFTTSSAAYATIRGREQQLIDFYGGIGNPMLGNSIRGVSKINPAGRIFHNLSSSIFGEIADYTGY